LIRAITSGGARPGDPREWPSVPARSTRGARPLRGQRRRR
jgi:hypothetical protein